MEANLIRLYNNASPAQRLQGAQWYKDAHAFVARIARETGTPLPTACAVTSALSPQLSWAKNKVAAEALLNGKRSKAAKAGVLRKSLYKAQVILSGKTTICARCPKARREHTDFCAIHAPKTFNFARNILDPDCSAYVTIDRHAATAYFGSLMRKKRFDYWPVAGAYLAAAHACGVKPTAFQATVWTVIRDRFAYWHDNRDGEINSIHQSEFTQEEIPF